MARKLRGFERVLDAPALFSVAYGEIASSLYFALGIVAAYALGFTPYVLLAAGAFFLLVALSYAEGTAAIPETGGAATFVRRAFNDLLGFLTGWALFLDYLIVIALSTLFLPHYLGAALDRPGLADSPWDVVIAVAVIATIAGIRLARHSRLYTAGIVVAGLDLATQLLLVVLGLALLFSPDALTSGISLGTAPSWEDLAFALPLALLAYTGLETVANLAEETRQPGRTLPRSLFSAIGLVVAITALIAVVGLSAFPVEDGQTALGDEWLRAPIAGIVDALGDPLPDGLAVGLRVYVGLTGALVLLAAATTSISGFTRLAHSLGGHGQLPRAFGRLNRRTLVSPQAIVAAAAISIATRRRHRPRRRRRRLPREPLLVRRAARVRRRTGRRDPAPVQRARPATSVPDALQCHDPGPRRARAGASRHGDRGRASGSSRSSRIPALATRGRSGSFSVWPCSSASVAAGGLIQNVERRLRAPTRRRLPAHSRAGEARACRRGDGRDGDRAREGAGGRGRCRLRDPRSARARARRRPGRAGRARGRVARRGTAPRRGARHRRQSGHGARSLDRPGDRCRGRRRATRI